MFTTAGAPSPCPRRRSQLNTEAKSAPDVSLARSSKSVAPAKKPAVGAKPKAGVPLKPRRPRSDRRSHRERRPMRRSWSADIAAAMTSRRPSRRDATPDAAPASRSAMAWLRETRRPPALGRRRPPTSLVVDRNRIGAWAHRRARGLAFGMGGHLSSWPVSCC